MRWVLVPSEDTTNHGGGNSYNCSTPWNETMIRLLLATRNPHKAREMGALFRDLPLRLATLEEFPGIPEVEEDATTLEENARKKAVTCSRSSGLWSLADD